jgi:uncharacterized membrane-anchored protein
MNKKILLYILVVIVLFAFPIYTIIVSTDTLKGGNEFLFKVQAFDPYDMFRGNYINIDFKEQYVEDSNIGNIVYGEKYFVGIDTRDDGYAYFSNISLEKPKDTADYYQTTGYSYYDNRCRIDTPNRYYMNENKSYNAEKIYNKNTDNTYVKVRVKNGKMVIVGVYVDGVLIDSIESQGI